MNHELEQRLLRKYTNLFKNYVEAGLINIDCEDGWYWLIESLCQQIYHNYELAKFRYETNYKKILKVDPKNYFDSEFLDLLLGNLESEERKLPLVTRIKEEQGALKIYTMGATIEHHAYIRFAENLSKKVCERCGTTKSVFTYKVALHKTLCSECSR